MPGILLILDPELGLHFLLATTLLSNFLLCYRGGGEDPGG